MRMASMERKSSQMRARLLLHLGRLAHGDAKVKTLTPAQWMVLRYLGSANRFSRTASAFASFHGTTRGTASQTIKLLVADGYLDRTRSKRDGRSTRLDLSPKGWAALTEDPYQALVEAIDRLPTHLASTFGNVLERLALDVSQALATTTFGSCEQCRNLEHDGTVGEESCTYYCLFAGEALAAEELDTLCVDFEPVRTRRLEAIRC